MGRCFLHSHSHCLAADSSGQRRLLFQSFLHPLRSPAAVHRPVAQAAPPLRPAAQPNNPVKRSDRAESEPVRRFSQRQTPARKRNGVEQSFGPPPGTQRLAKVLAAAGVASRRAAEDLITEGQVTVNGQQVLVPQTFVHPLKDEVKVKHKALPQAPAKKYVFALNKPKGCICASSRSELEGNARLVVDIFQDWITKDWKRDHLSSKAIPPRLFTVGRLDAQTTGLIFVTNDGPWAQSVQHPSSGLTKEYVVTTTTPYTAKQLNTIAAGCDVDGAFVAPVSLSLVTDQAARNKLRIVVSEGRNREVRRLVEHAGLKVVYLKRVRIGGYRLERDLGLGKFKLLKAHELRRVFDTSLQA